MNQTRYDRIKEGAALWLSYYRANPHKLAHDYLHIDLHLFQKILLMMMNWSTDTIFIGSRGIGKTFLSAIYCVTRCILYPGTKIVIVGGTRGQGINVLEKIQLELQPDSPELTAEIDEKKTKINGTNAQVVFKNSSYIKVVTASDNARGNRANVLFMDEFRMIPKEVIVTVLRKFLTQKRMPKYTKLTKSERKREWAKEKNVRIYATSAYFVDHWSYGQCQDVWEGMLDDTRRQFICGLPYQLSIAEGLIDVENVESEMYESDFNEIRFAMEYEALWYGNSDGNFFDYNSIAKNRRIKYPMLPGRLSVKLNNKSVRIPPKQQGEKRILSADIALMSSRKNKNDAPALFINQLMPTKVGRYMNNIVYTEAYEGLRTDDQALIIRRLFDEYDCDYLVLDTQGIGLGVFDYLASDISDPDSGEIYPALSCCNNEEMARRCTVPGAEKVIWSIKANADLNSTCAYALRDAFKNGRIRLLENEYEGKKLLSDMPSFNGLSLEEQGQILRAYYGTTALINEMTQLEHQEVGNKVRLHEKAGMRKDRYSSLAYNYYVASQLETKHRRKQNSSSVVSNTFLIKPPNIRGKAVNSAYGSRNPFCW